MQKLIAAPIAQQNVSFIILQQQANIVNPINRANVVTAAIKTTSGASSYKLHIDATKYDSARVKVKSKM